MRVLSNPPVSVIRLSIYLEEWGESSLESAEYNRRETLQACGALGALFSECRYCRRVMSICSLIGEKWCVAFDSMIEVVTRLSAASGASGHSWLTPHY
jgi:hypothetical protein